MEVICINEKGWFNGGGTIAGPVYMEQLSVTGVESDETYHGYYFSKWSTPFLSTEFIPLSEIDETEMERNYKTEKI